MESIREQLAGRPKEEWRGELIEVRQKFVETEMWVLFPELLSALRQVTEMMKRSSDSGKGRALQILCESGGGKSHFVKLLKKLWPDEETETASLVRIAAFSVPGAPTQDRLTRALLRAIGDSGWNMKSPTMERAYNFMDPLGVLAIAIDNVQDIPEHRGTIGTRMASNWLRDLTDECKRLVILLGTDASRNVIRSNPQFRRRAPKIIRIPYFQIEQPKRFARYKRFLVEVDKLLPLAESSGLEQYAKPIFWATYGIPDYIFKILAESIALAVSSGRERLIESDLAAGFDLVFENAGENLNPFLPGGPKRVLDGIDEPFEEWDANAAISNPTRNSKTTINKGKTSLRTALE